MSKCLAGRTFESQNAKTSTRSKCRKRTSAVIDSKTEDVFAQVEYIEKYISKIGSSKLTPDQIKYIQTKLPQLDSSKTSVKLTAQRIKSLVEISERGWKERQQPTQNHNFDNPQGEQN